MKDHWENERKFWAKGQVIYFGLCYDDFYDMWTGMFVPKTYWEENKCFPDTHVEYVLKEIYGLGAGDNDIGEVMENTFEFDGMSRDEVIEYLTRLGFTHNEELDCGEVE